MARDLDLLLGDMLGAARDAVRYASGRDQAAFENLPRTDGDAYRALKNAVTELGEAAKKLPTDVTDRNPEIDWSGICGLRDVVAHRYFNVDMMRLWPVVIREIPEMIPVLERELSNLSEPAEPARGFEP